IKSRHGFVVGDEGYRQDNDIQKVKLSREALTQLSKLVESRSRYDLNTILFLLELGLLPVHPICVILWDNVLSTE
ncbi:hypothetical protein HN873_071372, partial [Arachis hypogaea]